MNRKDKLIIIPCFNEEKNIRKTICSLNEQQGVLDNFDILVINDGSTDNSANIIDDFPDVMVITHPYNMGYGVAIQTGYKYAFQNDYSIVVQIDGDGQHDPKYILPIYKYLNENGLDMVIGSRFVQKTDYRMPLSRKIGSSIFKLIYCVITGKSIKDVTSGYLCLNRKTLRVSINDFFPYDFPDANFLILLHYFNIKVDEFTMEMYERAEKSMHNGVIKPAKYVFKMAFSIFLMILNRKKYKAFSKTLEDLR